MLVCLYCACLFLSSHCAASKIRGAVAGIPFEQFYKHSSEIIRTGIFGKEEDGKVRDELVFRANNLVSGVMSVCEGWGGGGGGGGGGGAIGCFGETTNILLLHVSSPPGDHQHSCSEH